MNGWSERRWSVGWASAGAVGWGVLMWSPGWLPLKASLIGRLMLLCPLVIVPLALRLILSEREARPAWHGWMQLAQPWAAWIAIGAFFFEPGVWATLFAIPWFVMTLVLGLLGLTRLLGRGRFDLAELCVDAGLMYIVVGGAWFVLTRAGFDLGFGVVIARLTAVHFHYAGFCAALLAGLIGRRLSPSAAFGNRLYLFSAAGVTAGPVLVGIGISGSPLLEFGAALFLILSILCLAILTLFWILPALSSSLCKVLLAISSLSSVVAMFFACMYAYGEVTRQMLISIPHMLLFHGLLNAVGFALAGVVAWFLLHPGTSQAS